MDYGIPVPSTPRTGLGTRLRRGLAASSGVVLPLLGLGLVLAAWYTATAFFGIRSVILPTPASVLDELVARPAYLAEHARVTLVQTLVGFGMTTAVGVAIGTVIAASRVVNRMTSPWLVALNAVPKVALAPLLVVWLGFEMESRVAMVILMCFFPIVLATTTGLTSTPNELSELARSLDAPRWRTFVTIRFPHALPQIFVGLKVAIPLAVVGSVIGEFRGNDGLGQVITRASAMADTKLAFAAIVVLSVMSVLLYYALVAVERLALPWVRNTTS